MAEVLVCPDCSAVEGHRDRCPGFRGGYRARIAQVITHPSALEPVLKASVEAAERGELPAQQRRRREREARIETLRGRLEKAARRVAFWLLTHRTARLLADAGLGKEMREAHEELKALGAEEE